MGGSVAGRTIAVTGQLAVDGTVLYATRGYRSGPYLAVALGGRGDVSEAGGRWRTG